MIRVRYTDNFGQQHEVVAEVGQSLMGVARAHGIPGIVAECGGACACASCHVYIEALWLTRLTAMEAVEDTMLDTVIERQTNSRLSCQIILNKDLDGLSFRVANNQQ